VTQTVGIGFEAYARVFHPPKGRWEGLRWADVAAGNGHQLSALSDWVQIRSVVPVDDHERRPASLDGDPEEGDLATEVLSALCGVLAEHTTTPQDCVFGVWEGWGWFNGSVAAAYFYPVGQPHIPPEPAPGSWFLDTRAPTITLPLERTYALYTGPVGDALRIGAWDTRDRFQPHSPNLMWPADHAWCVATEIDFNSTLVAGPGNLVQDIVANPNIEALTINIAAS
jgi:hypothetical protein